MIERIVGDFLQSNVFVVTKDDKCIVVDAGVETEKVKSIVGAKKVEAVLLTHGHFDHCFYALDYAKVFDCKIYTSEFSKEYLENPVYNYSDGDFCISDFSKFVFLDGNGKLNFDEFEISFYKLGGHSKSDVCFQVDDNIFVGDVLIGRDIGRIDLYGGDKNEMIESLKFLSKLNYKNMYSGHGEDNEKISQDSVVNLWLKYLIRK